MSRTMRLAVVAIAAAISLRTGAAAADDRHAGYYFPEPQSTEVYMARAVTLPDTDRKQRLAFVTGVTLKQANLPYPSNLAMFAKGLAMFARGDDATRSIIVDLQDGRMNTIYRARAVLAMLTAMGQAIADLPGIPRRGNRYLPRSVQDAWL